MDRRSTIPVALRHALLAAASVLIVGLGLPSIAARAADAPSFDTKARAHETRRLSNAAGQFYMVWWLPQTLSQAILRDTATLQQAEIDQRLQALEPYIVFALARGQMGANGLEDVHDRADLLRHSKFSVDGQTMTAAPDQNDPGAQAALEMIKPALAAMLVSSGLGSNGRGIEFVLYRLVPGMRPLDPTLPGSLEYILYHKHFQWRLPLWLAAAPEPVRTAPAVMGPSAQVAPAAAAAAATDAAAAVPMRAPAAAPVPVQHRKIDPVTGEEFPERYDYNPYTGQKLVSQ